MTHIQEPLQRLFSPPLDSSLVAAIAHEPQQTFQSAKEVLLFLATDVDPSFSLPSDHHAQRDDDDDDGAGQRRRQEQRTARLSTAIPNGDARFDSSPPASPSHLTTPDDVTPSAANTTTTSSTSTSTSTGTSTGTGTDSAPTSRPSSPASIERLLDEWKLVHRDAVDPDNLRLTDDEGDGDQDDEYHHEDEDQDDDEGKDSVEHDAGRYDAAEGVSGLDFLVHAFPSRSPEHVERTLIECAGDVQVALDTLMVLDMVENEALASQSDDEEPRGGSGGGGGGGGATGRFQGRGAAGLDLDRLAEGTQAGVKANKSARRAQRRRRQREQLRVMGLRDDGTALRPGAAAAAAPATTTAKPAAVAAAAPSSSSGALAGSGSGSRAKTKLNLTDVRRGAAFKTYLARPARAPDAAAAAAAARTPPPPPPLSQGPPDPDDALEADAALAARIAEEERRRQLRVHGGGHHSRRDDADGSRDDDEAGDDAVRDNDWLFTSSVLDRLADLLGVRPASLRSEYARTSFNLHLTAARVVQRAADANQSRAAAAAAVAAADDDEDVAAAAANAERAAEAQRVRLAAPVLAQTASCDVSSAERVLWAVEGCEDSALDALELLEVIRRRAPGEAPDALDPLGRLRLGEDVAGAATAAAAAAARPADPDEDDVDDERAKGVARGADRDAPLPFQAARLAAARGKKAASGVGRSNGYAAAMGSPRPNARPSGAAATVQAGLATATTLPASASPVQLPSEEAAAWGLPASFSTVASSSDATPFGRHRTDEFDAQRRARECRAIADDYRARRDACLRKAAEAYRAKPLRSTSTRGRHGAFGGGGAAWYYADEARRLEAKSRAWSLRAAQALVEDRRVAKMGAAAAAAGGAGLGRGHDGWASALDATQAARFTRRSAVGSSAGATPPTTTLASLSARNEIDLHGVTVHEALTIARQVLNAWWSHSSSSSNGTSRATTAPTPLRIVTGVGRHSPRNEARIRPALVRMLQREGWRCDVDVHRGVVTVRGLA